MAESKPYVLPNTQGRYLTNAIDKNNAAIYRVDGNKTIYADYINGAIVPSTFSSQEFKNNLSQGKYNSTIKNSINSALGTNPTIANPNQQGSPGRSQPTIPPNKSPKVEKTALVYPENLASSDQDRIKFQALIHASKALPGNTEKSFETVKPSSYDTAGIPVYLPIQSSISDQNSVGWEPDTLNPIELKAVQLSMSMMENQNMAELQTEVGKQFTEAMKTLKREQQAVRTYLAGQAVGVNNLLSRLNGQVLNPNLELLFQGPQLRPFSFTFKLSARNKSEATTIKEIIHYFKYHMSPIAERGALFIKAPHIFSIEYQHKGQRHPGINYLKECALTSCSVDYTPLGSYMTYEDATMVAYTMTLQFQELEPVYSRDYSESSSNIEY